MSTDIYEEVPDQHPASATQTTSISMMENTAYAHILKDRQN